MTPSIRQLLKVFCGLATVWFFAIFSLSPAAFAQETATVAPSIAGHTTGSTTGSTVAPYDPTKEENPLRFSADSYRTNLKTRQIFAEGHVKVKFDDYDVSGEKLEYSPDTGSLVVTGGFKLDHPMYKIDGDHFQYDTQIKTGTFYDSKMRHVKGIIVQANELRVITSDNFQIYQGSITTCDDCPAAWSFVGAYIDFTVEGYAEIHHAVVQIKDLPIFYFPILIIPVKAKRQSGFLFPNYGYNSQLGSQVAQSYYWAPRPDFDSLMEYRFFTRAGSKVSNETRYMYSDRSFVDLNGNYVNNLHLEDVKNNRYGIRLDQRFQITPHWTQRWYGEWVSDPRFLEQFQKSYSSYELPVVSNNPSVSWQSNDYLFTARGSMHQDNLQRADQFSSTATGLGPISVEPQLIFSQPTKPLYGRINSAWDLEWLSLRRARGTPDPNTGWIRTGDRATADLRLGTTVTPGDVLAWDPSVEFRSDVYRLDTAPGTSSAAIRGRVVTQQQLSSEFYNLYDSDLGTLRALRHAIVPSVRWSYSPKDALSRNPFFHQDADFSDGRGRLDSPRFDLFDPHPSDFSSGAVFTTADDEARLQQHHLLTLGVDTTLVGRFGEENKRYEKLLDVSLAQDYNLQSDSIGLLRFTSTIGYGPFQSSFDWIYDSHAQNTSTRVAAAYDDKFLLLSVSHQQSSDINSISAAAGLSDVYGFNMLTSATYDLRQSVNQFVREEFRVGYKAASHCWYFSLDMQRQPDLEHVGKNAWNFSPNIGIAMSTDTFDVHEGG